MTKLTPAQQKFWDAGFVRALRLMKRGPKNRAWWPEHEKRLAAKVFKARKKK